MFFFCTMAFVSTKMTRVQGDRRKLFFFVLELNYLKYRQHIEGRKFLIYSNKYLDAAVVHRNFFMTIERSQRRVLI